MIYGGFEFLVYTSADSDGTDATPRGITTRINPILDTSNINVRGTGRRGLYDILLGMRQPQFTMDILPTDIDFIADNQLGQTEIGRLHLRKLPSGPGLTFKNVYFNRVSVESRHNEAISSTIEVWAKDLLSLTSQNFLSFSDVVPYRWLHSELTIIATIEPQWWSWRYEINNNLQRLGSVTTGLTRDIKARHKEVTGLIVKDLEGFDEWWQFMVEKDKFNIGIRVNGSGSPGSGSWKPLISQPYCRWGRMEAPVGPEDLQAKRFPFTAIDVT